MPDGSDCVDHLVNRDFLLSLFDLRKPVVLAEKLDQNGLAQRVVHFVLEVHVLPETIGAQREVVDVSHAVRVEHAVAERCVVHAPL